ncbi:MAG: 50S ribosomal protein L21 [Gammaproteobacteria bacterium]|nr:50S ribosomal protein L21 [Gammaproteobacteria bacterium]MXX07568.1 50S ribosomal protein L21 [Gammaproteobacteria bacterium]MYA66431.1 50S ribosomal protein L21 [Gammaproteobacteria bacterium]MYE30841.1 50S ribosomal protein L21 [Gammaproteobacteria bacterium]MYH45791.1 50S ribosomal protein L21 [Gammaproteobacteria bacterium]
MYAVIESGGKQHRVSEGEVLRLEKLELEVGATVTFDKVLMIGEGAEVKVGQPYVEGSSVEAEVLNQGRGEKIRIVKFNRRKHHRKQMGHRQWFTEVKITGIKA